MPRSVLIEGYSAEQVLALSNEELAQFVFRGEPVVFRIGSAEILGHLRISADTLVLELGHIDGGGEGALPTLAALATRYALREGLAYLEWQVHAVHCARPNLKLRRVPGRRNLSCS